MSVWRKKFLSQCSHQIKPCASSPQCLVQVGLAPFPARASLQLLHTMEPTSSPGGPLNTRSCFLLAKTPSSSLRKPSGLVTVVSWQSTQLPAISSLHDKTTGHASTGSSGQSTAVQCSFQAALYNALLPLPTSSDSGTLKRP